MVSHIERGASTRNVSQQLHSHNEFNIAKNPTPKLHLLPHPPQQTPHPPNSLNLHKAPTQMGRPRGSHEMVPTSTKITQLLVQQQTTQWSPPNDLRQITSPCHNTIRNHSMAPQSARQNCLETPCQEYTIKR